MWIYYSIYVDLNGLHFHIKNLILLLFLLFKKLNNINNIEISIHFKIPPSRLVTCNIYNI